MTDWKKRWRNVEFKVISSSAAKKYPDTEGQKGGGYGVIEVPHSRSAGERGKKKKVDCQWSQASGDRNVGAKICVLRTQRVDLSGYFLEMRTGEQC